MTQYQFTVNCSAATVQSLKNEGFQLYAFKGAGGASQSVAPVWFSNDFNKYQETTMTFSYDVDYGIGQVSSLTPNQPAKGSNPYTGTVKLAQQYTFTAPQWSNTGGAPTGIIEIKLAGNSTNFYISSASPGASSGAVSTIDPPMIGVANAPGKGDVQFEPFQQVLLVWAESSLIPGVLKTTVAGTSCLMLVNPPGETTSSVTYDYDSGNWTAGASTALQQLASGINFAPQLNSRQSAAVLT